MKKTRCLHIAALLLVIMSFIFVPPAPAYTEISRLFESSTLQRLVYMPNGAGPFRYYAQNDPVWDRLVYEVYNSPTQRPFGDGGCNPTALAMVVASLVPVEHLNLLGMSAAPGRTYTPCTCSVNTHYCHMGRKDPTHMPFTLISGEDFMNALPLAFADFATGNNSDRQRHRLQSISHGGNGGTSKTLFDPIAKIYGLPLRTTRDMNEIYGALDRGGMVIALCSGKSQIFSGTNGHYVVIASYDDNSLYVMDPFVRDTYKKDRRGLIEKLDDGILRVKRSSASTLGFGTFALFEPAPEAYYAGYPILLNPYTREIAITRAP